MKAQMIRYNRINERVEKSLLPFLSQRIAGDPYLRIKNTALLIGFVGLNEAVKAMTGQEAYLDKHATEFAVKIVDHLTSQAREFSKKERYRVAVSQIGYQNSSHRLAKLDVETFGWGTVVAKGPRSTPYYTDLVTAPLEANVALRERLSIESRFHPLLLGGHLALIEIEETTPEALLRLTREICRTSTLGAYAFGRSLSYCFHCQRRFDKHVSKCPECASESAFLRYSRLSSKYLPLDGGALGKRVARIERVRYRVV
jgi:ribonucleoside-triphosphate reductase